MNWNELPLNTSKLYLTIELTGGCHLFVPLAEKATVNDIDKTRKELEGFANWQRWAINGGNYTA